MNWDVSTKFGLLIDFDIPNTVASTSKKPEVVLSRRGRHLEKSIWRHISALGRPMWMKFGNFITEYHADYGDVVKVETGKRISIWRMIVFAKTEIVISGPWIELSWRYLVRW